MLNLDQQNQLRAKYQRLNPTWQPATEYYAAVVRSYLEPAARILDLGCGRGGLVEQLDHPPSLITGIDPDWRSLTEHRLAGINRVTASSERLPLCPQSFDLALASWLFEHLAQPEQALRQVFRALKPGGVLIFITPNGRHPIALLNHLLGRTGEVQAALVKGLYGRDAADTFSTHYQANTPRQLGQLARRSGFELAALTTVADPTYLAFTPALFAPACLLEEALPESRHIHLVGVFKRPA